MTKENDKRTIEVEILQYGQPRAYADHIYEGYLRYSSNGLWGSEVDMETAKKEAKVLIRNFVEKEGKEWHQTYLEECRNEVKNVFYFKIIQPYID